jgi:hypothetical protein
MATVWTAEEDENLQHMLVMNFHIRDVSRAVNHTRKQTIKRIEELKKKGWDGRTDPVPGKPLPTGYVAPDKPSRLRRVTHWGARKALDNTFKKGSFIHNVLSRRLGGDPLGGKDGKVDALTALNDYHKASIASLNDINAKIFHGTSTVTRSMTELSDKVTFSLDRMTDILDHGSFGTSANKDDAPAPVPMQETGLKPVSSINELKGGKGMFKKLGLLGVAGAALIPRGAKASTNPNDKIEPSNDDPKPIENPKDTEAKLRDEGQGDADSAKAPLQELEIKGENLTFKGQSITFEADEFDISGLGGKGNGDNKAKDKAKAKGQEGFQDGVPPPGPGSGDGSPKPGEATSGSGSIMDKLKNMLSPKQPNKRGGKGGNDKPDTDQPATQKPASTGFTPLPQGQSLGQEKPGEPPGTGGNDTGPGGSAPMPSMPDTDALGNPLGGSNQAAGKGPATPNSFNGKLPQLGMNADKFTPDVKSGGQFGSLESQRAGYNDQMTKNPEMKDRLLAMALAEEGGDSKSRMRLMESALNRGNSQGMKDFGSIINPKGGGSKEYYAPYNDGNYNKAVGQLSGNPKLKEQLVKEYDEVMKGSNHSNLATDNGSGSVKANAIARGDTVASTGDNGEAFIRKDKNPNQHGAKWVDNVAKWRDQTTAAMGKDGANGNKVAGPGVPAQAPISNLKTTPVDPSAVPGGFDNTSMKNQKLLQDNTKDTPRPQQSAIPQQSFEDKWKDSGAQLPGGAGGSGSGDGPKRTYVFPLGGSTPDVQSESPPIPAPQTPANADFLDSSEKGTTTNMLMQQPQVNDQGAVNGDTSSGRSANDVRGDLQNNDNDMQTAMDDHFNGGDFPGLGDQSNSDTDTALA